MKNSSKMMFFLMLIMSSLMVMSSENWISMWMGLEINMMAFIPLMSKNKNYNSPEASIIYFMIQSMSSVMLLMSIIMNPMMMVKSNLTEMFQIIMMISICMKMGMAPLHFWFTEIIQKMNWTNSCILMTWQKIAPMTILSTMELHKTMFIMIIMSTIIGAIGGINQTSIQKILAYSSINHMGWMTMCMKMENNMWIKYLIIYSMMILFMTMMFNEMSVFFINQMSTYIKTPMEKFIIIMSFLSLGGLPPFIGFLPKWMVIESTMNKEMNMMMIMMIMMSIITLFFYMRIMSPMMLINSSINKWNMNNNKKNSQNMFMTMNLLLMMASIISF